MAGVIAVTVVTYIQHILYEFVMYIICLGGLILPLQLTVVYLVPLSMDLWRATLTLQNVQWCSTAVTQVLFQRGGSELCALGVGGVQILLIWTAPQVCLMRMQYVLWWAKARLQNSGEYQNDIRCWTGIYFQQSTFMSLTDHYVTDYHHWSQWNAMWLPMYR